MNNESMVYLNKVFTDVNIKSCPLLSEFAADGETFEQQLSFYDQNDGNSCGCGCGCNNSCSTCLEFDDDLNFVIDSTEVIMNDFRLADPDTLAASDITVDGIPVDALEFFNERFMASTNGLLSQISDCTCLEQGRSIKGMLLIQNAGCWTAKVTIVIRGSVFGCGGCKRFRLLMSTRDEMTIPIPGNSTFAVTSICLPCTSGGIAPVINFSFDAKATLLNPTIVTDSGSGTCNIIVTGALVTEPIANIQVTRQTLFNITAEAVEQPCDDLRRCNQFPGTCNCADDAGNAFPIRNRCCNDAVCEADDSTIPTEDSNSDCGCRRQNEHNDHSRCRQISCQWNGCNGCGF